MERTSGAGTSSSSLEAQVCDHRRYGYATLATNAHVLDYNFWSRLLKFHYPLPKRMNEWSYMYIHVHVHVYIRVYTCTVYVHCVYV